MDRRLSKIFADWDTSWNDSLGARLRAVILAPICAALIITALFTGITTYHEANEVYDTQLAYMAKALLAIEVKEQGRRFIADDSPDVDLEPFYKKSDKKLAFRVWRSGSIWHRSNNAEHFGDPIETEGYSTRKLDGKYWHVFVLSDIKNDLMIEVAQRNTLRREMTFQIVGAITIPLLIVLPLIFIFTRRATRWGLRPLNALSREVSKRSPDDLGKITTQRQPREMEPILHSLNDLLAKLSTALEAERRFTDYAAHELRTPLAAIKTLFHAACKSTDTSERERLVGKLGEAIDRSTYLVAQLLSLARIGTEKLAISPTDIAQTLESCMEELETKTREKALQILRLLPDTPCIVETHSALLRTLILNILRNALYYSPASSTIELMLEARATDALLTITDSGPGIPEAERGQVFRSFHRGDRPSPDGAGLGLAIVHNIAQKLKIDVGLHSAETGTGLKVTIRIPKQVFPAADNAS